MQTSSIFISLRNLWIDCCNKSSNVTHIVAQVKLLRLYKHEYVYPDFLFLLNFFSMHCQHARCNIGTLLKVIKSCPLCQSFPLLTHLEQPEVTSVKHFLTRKQLQKWSKEQGKRIPPTEQEVVLSLPFILYSINLQLTFVFLTKPLSICTCFQGHN